MSRNTPNGVGEWSSWLSRASANASDGSWRCASWIEDLLGGDVGAFDESELAVDAHRHGALLLGAERDRLAVHEVDHHLVAGLLLGDLVELAVVEDVAVLVDLDERRAVVVVGGAERLDHVLAVEVVGAGDEAGLGAERDGERVERRVDRAHRRRLGDLADR